MTDFPFLGGSFNVRSPSFDAQRTVNMYLEPSESGNSRGAGVLYGTPGLERWLNLPTGRVRGMIVFSPTVSIVVAGYGVWQVTDTKNAKQIGTVTNNTNVVSMASNGTVIMLGCGSDGYFIDPAKSTVTPIPGDNFYGATRVDFLDGYLVFNHPGTGQFQITGLYSTSIDGLDFATAEGAPDNLISLIVDHRELWLLGETTTEVWINAGGLDFPFQRVQGAFLEIGCAAAQSVAKLDNSIFWLAKDDRGIGTVQRAAGYTPQRVSNHAVEYAVAQYAKNSRIDDAVAYTYEQEGHSFYVLSFPTARATWVFDAATNLWHERAYLDPATRTLDRHRSNCYMNFAGKALVGDWASGIIYSMDLDVFTDDGEELPAIRVCPHIANDAKGVLFLALELTMQTGVGQSTGQGLDPQAMLQWSDDGGYTWSNERDASVGKIGETRTRVRWTRLGRSRDRIFRVTITDPVRRVITGASLTTAACAV